MWGRPCCDASHHCMVVTQAPGRRPGLWKSKQVLINSYHHGEGGREKRRGGQRLTETASRYKGSPRLSWPSAILSFFHPEVVKCKKAYLTCLSPPLPFITTKKEKKKGYSRRVEVGASPSWAALLLSDGRAITKGDIKSGVTLGK